LGCDFFVFSAHKIYGPTGIGILYGKEKILEELPPFLGGGEMISEVDFSGTTYNQLPYKFEAGTPNIADTVALTKAFTFINEIGKGNIQEHEQHLLKVGTEMLSKIPGITIWGTASNKTAVISFTHETIHHFDLGMMLDARGIAVRTGHHCCQPLMKQFGLDGTARASFGLYNTEEEVVTFAENLEQVVKKFG
jgi:cysteine desulfurase/selenocysteine lyase